jgi:predicted DCC family thiol-disulfide oxidoreductase YuxK
MDPKPAIILFDGVCNLCNGTVQFIVKRDRAARFRFASLQGEAARRVCAEAGIAAPDAREPDSIIVLAEGRALERSDAVLAIAARLPFPWPLLGAFRVLPQGLRDLAYRFVARRRYRWFGRRKSCMVPTPALCDRFID